MKIGIFNKSSTPVQYPYSLKPLIRLHLSAISLWRRRESNPRPKALTLKRLRVYFAYLGFARHYAGNHGVLGAILRISSAASEKDVVSRKLSLLTTMGVELKAVQSAYAANARLLFCLPVIIVSFRGAEPSAQIPNSDHPVESVTSPQLGMWNTYLEDVRAAVKLSDFVVSFARVSNPYAPLPIALVNSSVLYPRLNYHLSI